MLYNLLKKETVKNIGECFLYEHKTGAKIVYIKNEDKNKVFSVSFTTTPEDNTGVFHILEHCLLCGSRKYPLKEPFNLLDKYTINTYLNAITFADKTIYPVGSTNDKSFKILVDVYLDAVFFPLIKNKKGIFLQEGHNYNGETINGVVYNEMEGAYSNPDDILDFKVMQKLFEGSCYCFSSGGYPENIPELTYDKFLNTYNKFYTPSNSIIYFYGDLDIDYYLDYLHNEYLSYFKRQDKIEVKESNCFEKPIFIEEFYSSDDEDINYIQITYKLKFKLDVIKNIAFDILSDILTENINAVLKDKFLYTGICSDLVSYVDEDLLEPIYTILLYDTKNITLDEVKEILENEIKNINIDNNYLQSNIDSIELYFKEKDFGYKPQGLFYNLELLKYMNYGIYDFSILDFDKIIDDVRKVDFNKLLLDNILYNSNVVFASLKNKNIKNEKIIYDLEENVDILKEYQNEIDSEENINKIAILNINDIEKDIIKLDTKLLDFKNRPFIFNNINSEITYFDMIINIDDFSKIYGEYISLYIYLIGKLPTKNYSLEKLEQFIYSYFSDKTRTCNGVVSLNDKKFFTSFSFSTRILNKNLKSAFSLIGEIFTNTIFEDKNLIKKHILQYYNKIKQEILKYPNIYSIKRGLSYFCEEDFYIENVDGINFYYWLKDLAENIDKKLDDIIENLSYIHNNIFNINNAYFCVSANESIQKDIYKCMEYLYMLKNIKHINKKIKGLVNTRNEAFYINSNVNYNAKVAKIDNFIYNGNISVLKTIVQSDYIWTKIRTEGGAYGGDIYVYEKGILYLNSFSDPNIEKTYKNFDMLSTYLKNLNINDKELQTYIIGTINRVDRPLKNHKVSEEAIVRYFHKLDDEKLKERREQLLSTTVNDLKLYAEMFDNALKSGYICTIGSKENIKETNIFDYKRNV